MDSPDRPLMSFALRLRALMTPTDMAPTLGW